MLTVIIKWFLISKQFEIFISLLFLFFFFLEIGVNLRSSSIIKYDFLGSWRSTIQESIRVGFTTTNPRGFLLGFASNISGEYLTIQVSNSGHLRVVFDFGFERQELIYPEKQFHLGQYHNFWFQRRNGGKTVVLTVDNYEPKEYHFDIKDSADAQFNNIQYLYVGKNESMKDGFVGCVSRVEFDDIYPLKLMFQENPPPNVKSLGTPLTEDFCGVEPVTHPPTEIETRPPPIIDQDKLRRAYNQVDSAILGSEYSNFFTFFVFPTIVTLKKELENDLKGFGGEYFNCLFLCHIRQSKRGVEDCFIAILNLMFILQLFDNMFS